MGQEEGEEGECLELQSPTFQTSLTSRNLCHTGDHWSRARTTDQGMRALRWLSSHEAWASHGSSGAHWGGGWGGRSLTHGAVGSGTGLCTGAQPAHCLGALGPKVPPLQAQL